MNTGSGIPLIDFINCFSNTLDLVSPSVMNHHKRVAYIAFRIATELKLPRREVENIFLASLLHDIGVFSLNDRLNALQFEIDFKQPGLLYHGLLGQTFLEKYFPLLEVAPLVGAHHLYWQDRGSYPCDAATLLGSQIIHLADRTDILVDGNQAILGQIPGLMSRIEEQAGKMFHPEPVRVLKALSTQESFWFDIVNPQNIPMIAAQFEPDMLRLDSDGLLSLAKAFCHIIDFRSPFTATHSVGVSVCARALAELMNFSAREAHDMQIAGYLHDLGKLAIPLEILEKPDKLTESEYDIIKSHSYYGYRALETVPGLQRVNTWGSLHHERLDGQGYPFHIEAKDLSTGSRIVAVADIFTALSEDRPYRKGLAAEKALQILIKHAEKGAIDRDVVAVLAENINQVNDLRDKAQNEAGLEYQNFSAKQELKAV